MGVGKATWNSQRIRSPRALVSIERVSPVATTAIITGLPRPTQEPATPVDWFRHSDDAFCVPRHNRRENPGIFESCPDSQREQRGRQSPAKKRSGGEITSKQEDNTKELS